MKGIFALPMLATALALNASAVQVLWAALDEDSRIEVNGTYWSVLDYRDSNWRFVNAARLVANGAQMALWIPEYDGNPAFWEEDFPVVCLKDEDGWYGMPVWSSQFSAGENPDDSEVIVFELGYVDWSDDTSPFVPLATAESTYGQLRDDRHTYESGTIAPPDESNWMPTMFQGLGPVPEPSVSTLLLVGAVVLLAWRKVP